VTGGEKGKSSLLSVLAQIHPDFLRPPLGVEVSSKRPISH
jgi:hypothetical protein